MKEAVENSLPLYLKVGESFKIAPKLDNQPRGHYLVLDEIPIHLDSYGDGAITVCKEILYPIGYVYTPAGPINIEAVMDGNALLIKTETAPIKTLFSLKGNLNKIKNLILELEIDEQNYKGFGDGFFNRPGSQEGGINFFGWKHTNRQVPELPGKILNPPEGHLYFPNDPEAFKRCVFKFSKRK